MAEEISKVIRDFVNFDIVNNYYNKEEKEELVRQFKKIIYEDDVTIRKFLESFFEKTKQLADEYSLIGDEDDVEDVTDGEDDDEIDVEEPEEDDEIEEPEEDEEPKGESIKRKRNRLWENYTESASDLIIW